MTAITGQPAYRQIADDLRRQIADGGYDLGAALPSTARLMEMYNVSNTAVRAAIRELQSEGVLIGQPGKGVFVARKPSEAAIDMSTQVATLAEQVHALSERVAKLESKAGQ